MSNPQAEFCTQIEVRYYLQYRTDSESKSWSNYQRFCRGFKSERNAARTLRQLRKTRYPDFAENDYRMVKEIKTIEIKTTTEIEVLNEN